MKKTNMKYDEPAPPISTLTLEELLGLAKVTEGTKAIGDEAYDAMMDDAAELKLGIMAALHGAQLPGCAVALSEVLEDVLLQMDAGVRKCLILDIIHHLTAGKMSEL